MRISFRSACVLAMVAGALVGCGKKPSPPPAVTASTVPASTAGLTSNPISDEEARAFGEKYVAVMKSRDLAQVNAVFDMDALATRSLEGVDFPATMVEPIRKGIRTGLTGETGLVGQIGKNLNEGGSYRILQTHDVDGHKRVMLRMLAPQVGVNYHDLVLNKDVSGTVKAIDVHVFLTGELISSTMKRVFIPIAAQENRSILEKMAGKDQAFARNFPEVIKMTSAVTNGRPEEAIKIYRTLPPAVQQEKVVLIMRFRAASEMGDEQEYDQSIEDFRLYHPKDKCIEFMSIDYYFSRKEFDNVMKAIDEVDKAVGGDPYLNVMRANAAMESKDTDAAVRYTKAAIDAEGGLEAAWWALVTIRLRENDFADVVKLLKEIDGRFHPAWEDMTKLPTYAEFVKSPQYDEWKAWLSEGNKP